MAITEFLGVAELGDRFGSPSSTISPQGGHVSALWRIQPEMRRPTFWVCPECGVNVPTRRQTCLSVNCAGRRAPEKNCTRVYTRVRYEASVLSVGLLQELASETVDAE